MSLINKIDEIREYSAKKLIKLKCDLDYKKFEREGYRQQLRQRIVFNEDFDSIRDIKIDTFSLVRERIYNEQGGKYWWKSIPEF
jgi:hypothetical protein